MISLNITLVFNALQWIWLFFPAFYIHSILTWPAIQILNLIFAIKFAHHCCFRGDQSGAVMGCLLAMPGGSWFNSILSPIPDKVATDRASSIKSAKSLSPAKSDTTSQFLWHHRPTQSTFTAYIYSLNHNTNTPSCFYRPANILSPWG